MKSRSVICFLIALVALSCPVWSYDGYGPDHKNFKLQTQVFSVVNQFWVVEDLFVKALQNPENTESYNKACEIYQKQSLEMGKDLLTSLDDPKRDVLTVVSEIYKSLDDIGRQSMYPALGYLRNDLKQQLRAPLTEAEFREYFPGYGYTEPGYKYRKGREIEREHKGTTWQSEEHSITTTFSVKLTVTLDVLGMLKGMVANGTIKNLVVGQQYETEVNGTPMIVVEVSFQVIKSIITKTNRKFDVNKIWFELLRAKLSGNWGEIGPWEICGKTYEIINEPTGEEVVTGVH